ncbi:aa3-type cytochrome c oxidase subunit IV [Alsobacter sp. KACC 23698]|jgi:hypothetical protein|uniref:Aa3-type cytochrome c oxidase subunit IV n=1 Tax=Alsobacter sp. KACC 23698 TaxID=3149229 RepID=A0AAU7JFR0_9HYPH
MEQRVAGQPPQVDLEEHERTYRMFVRGCRYVALAVPLILLFIFYWTE